MPRITERQVALICAVVIIAVGFAASNKSVQEFCKDKYELASVEVHRLLMSQFERDIIDGQDALDNDDLAGAYKFATAAAKAQPDSIKPHEILMTAYFGAKDYNAVVQCCNAILLKEPKHLEALRYRSMSECKLGRYQKAYEDAGAALALSSRNYQCMNAMGEASLRLNRPREAFYFFEKAAKSGDATYVPIAGMGDVCLARKLYRDAVSCYTSALSLQKTAAVYANRSLAYKNLRSGEPALNDIDAALKLDPNNPRYLCDKADILTAVGWPYKALDLLDYPATYTYPSNKRMATALKTAALELVRYAERGRRYNPNDANVYNDLAYGLFYSAQKDKALAAANKAIDLNPSSRDALKIRGIIEHKQQ